jgi:hypothetical protein
MALNKILTVKDFLKYPVKTLNTVGFQLYLEEIPTLRTRRQKALIILHKSFLVLCIATFLLTLALIVAWIVESSHDPLLRLRGILNAMNNTCILVRLVMICANREKINKCIGILEQVMPTTVKQQKRHKVSRVLRKLRKQQRVYISVCIFPLVIFTIHFVIHVITGKTDEFTFDIWLPFDYRKMLNFIIVNLYTIWSGFPLEVALFVGTWITYSLIVVLSMEFRIVARNIRRLLKNPNAKISDFKEAVEQHNQLMEAKDIIESALGPFFLLLFITSSIIISLAGFHVILTKDSKQATINVGVLIIMTEEIFLLNHYGQKLIDASTSVSDTIYASKWYRVKDMQVKKMLPMMMTISQKSKCLSGLDLVDFRYETFAGVSFAIFFDILKIKF